MKIVDLIQHESIIPTLVSRDRNAILNELANHLSSLHENLDKGDVSRVLIEREEIASTAIGDGIAIPHGKLPALDRIVACLGRAESGVDFGAGDGQPTYLFFVMVAPKNSSGAHLKALARISRIFNTPEFRARLLGAVDAEEMYKVIEDEEVAC